MGILVVFILFLILLTTIAGATLFYRISHVLFINWLHLPFSTVWIWGIICLIINIINLSFLLFLFNDSKNDNPNPGIIWLFLMGVSVLLSIATFFIGLKMIKP